LFFAAPRIAAERHDCLFCLPTMSAPAYFHNDQPITRDAFYAIACDPRRSAAGLVPLRYIILFF